MKEHTQEVVKHGVDGVAGGTIVLAWIELLTPVLNFVGLILAIIWGIYRIRDMQLSSKLKQHELDDKKGQ